MYKFQNYCVYKVQSPSGGIYIGITNDFERRKYEHEKESNKSVLSKAIKKYGKDNMVWEVIYYTDDAIHLKETEIYFISYFNSFVKGYNMSEGGDRCYINRSLNDENILKIRELLQNTNLSCREIGDIYGVDGTTILDIKNGTRWKHLTGGSKIIRDEYASVRGSYSRSSKLTEEIVETIKRDLSLGVSRSEIEKRTGVSKGLIQQIATEVIWKHVVVPDYLYEEKETNGNAKLTKELVKKLKTMLEMDYSQYQLAAYFNVSRGTVQNIKYGKVWEWVEPDNTIYTDLPEKWIKKERNKDTWARGAKSNSNLTDEIVIEMKTYFMAGMKAPELARMYDLKLDHVRGILTEKSWKHVTVPGYKYEVNTKFKNSLTEENVREIKQMLLGGIKKKDIANKFSVGVNTISRIASGETWSHVEV